MTSIQFSQSVSYYRLCYEIGDSIPVSRYARSRSFEEQTIQSVPYPKVGWGRIASLVIGHRLRGCDRDVTPNEPVVTIAQ